MTQPLASLKDIYPNSDIYVVGSGPSLNYIDTAFFTNKIVICINYTIDHIPKAKRLFLVAKEPSRRMQEVAKDKGAEIIMCERHSGVPKNPLNEIAFPGITYIFEPNTNVIKDKSQTKFLERSSSTIVTGIHLAAFLGAKNVILVGHDCGFLNGNMHVLNYNKKEAIMRGKDSYIKWMQHNKVEKKTIEAKRLLKEFQDVNVYSLNPFINLGLEGNKYKPFGPGES